MQLFVQGNCIYLKACEIFCSFELETTYQELSIGTKYVAFHSKLTKTQSYELETFYRF